MTIHIGRVGRTFGTVEVESIDVDGDRVTLTGEIIGATVTEAKALRQQLSGYVDNPDEPIIPVVWDDDSTVDGFYRVLGARVGSVSTSLNTPWFPYSLQLERIQGYATPVFESTYLYGVRTNAHTWAVTDQTPLAAAPKSGFASFTTGWSEVREAEGTAAVVVKDVGSGTVPDVVSPTWWTPPASFYDGAARIEVDYGDGTPRPVVGGQAPNRTGSASLWRISNGLLRVSPLPASSTPELYVEVWKESVGAWQGTTFPLGDNFTALSVHAVTTVRIVRNSPELCVLDVVFVLNTPTQPTFTMRIGLRRGHRMVEASTVFTSPSVAAQWSVQARSGTGSTAGVITGAMRRSAVDGDGNTWVIVSPDGPLTYRTVADPGVALTNLESSFRFGVGITPDAAGETTYGPYIALSKQYASAMTETARVVER